MSTIGNISVPQQRFPQTSKLEKKEEETKDSVDIKGTLGDIGKEALRFTLIIPNTLIGGAKGAIKGSIDTAAKGLELEKCCDESKVESGWKCLVAGVITGAVLGAAATGGPVGAIVGMLAGPGIIGSGLVAIEGACSGVKDGANFSVHTGDLVKAFVGSKLGEKAGKVAGFLTTGVTGAVAIPVMAIVKGVDEGAIKFPQKTGVLGEFSTTFASLYGLIKYGIPGGILLGGGVATIIGGVMGGLKGVLEGAKASYNPPSNT